MLYDELSRLPDLDLRYVAVESPLADALLCRATETLPFVDDERVRRSYRYRGVSDRFVARWLTPHILPRSERRLARTLARQVRSVIKRLAVPRPHAERGDVYHSPFAALPPRERCPAPARVLTVHDIIPLVAPQFCREFGTRIIEEVLASIDHAADVVIAPSEFTRDDVCAATGFDPARVRVIAWAADPAVFTPVDDAARIAALRSRYAIPDGPFFLSLSTLEPRKNFAHLIRAFEALVARDDVPTASLVLAGSKGWIYDEIFASARDARCRDRVIFTGRVPDEDLATLYSAARGFVFVSLYEGFGLPVLEAMQCGTPVIASGTTSIPEVTGDAAWLVDPTDREALVGAMAGLLHDAQRTEALRAAGIARAAEFSWKRCALQTRDAFAFAIDAARNSNRAAYPAPLAPAGAARRA